MYDRLRIIQKNERIRTLRMGERKKRPSKEFGLETSSSEKFLIPTSYLSPPHAQRLQLGIPVKIAIIKK